MNRCILLYFCVFFVAQLQAQTFWAIVATDIEDKDLGIASLSDAEIMQKTFETAAWGINYKLQLISLNKRDFKSSVIRDKIKAIPAKPNDLIFFYYSGLGYYPPNSISEYPFLTLKDYEKDPISLDEIADLILSKKARFGTAMADCRNTLFDTTPVVASTQVIEDIRALILKKLFLEPCGIVKVASAQKNERILSLKTPYSGSLFTAFFVDEFEQRLWGNLEEINGYSLDNLLSSTKNIADYNGQHPIWASYGCDVKKQQAQKMSFETILSAATIQARFNEIVITENLKEKKKLIDQLGHYFAKDARVMVYGDINQSQITIKQYLQSLLINTSQIKQIFLLPGGLKRTNDFILIKQIAVQYIR